MRRISFVCIFIFLFSCESSFAKEVATFEALYESSTNIGLIGWIFGAALAAIAAATIYFTGGAASPVVVSIGTAIGNLAGYSGVVATNYGLALLGGGAIASGGLGIAGGVALLTAALTFSTEVVVDYAATNVINKYSYSSFVEQSKSMMTLPLPLNDSGSSAYKDAIKRLKKSINNQESYSSNQNKEIILITVDDLESNFSSDSDDRLKEEVLRSILYFNAFDYVKAKKYAESAIAMANSLGLQSTIPSFIYAVCSLYEDKFDFEEITNNYFRPSIVNEPDNKLMSLMFAIYMDRILYRIEDGALNEEAFFKLAKIADEESLKAHREANFSVILIRYFLVLKNHQQRIYSLCNSSNETITGNPLTLVQVRKSLETYENTLLNADYAIKRIIFPDETSLFSRLKGVPNFDEKNKGKRAFYELVVNYLRDKQNLILAVDDLNLKILKKAKDCKIEVIVKQEEIEGGEEYLAIVWVILGVISGLCLTIGYYIGRRAGMKKTQQGTNA